MSKYQTWLLLVMLLIVAAVLRFYNVNYTMIFQADQGRDALIVSRIFKEGDLVAIGPITSVGNLYLGPFYYYFMMPFLWLGYPSPLGPVYAVALMGILTVWLSYRVGRDLLNQDAGWLAMGLTALSSVLIYYSRFSWNPNLVPFFTLLMVYATYKALSQSPWYWVLVAAAFSVLLQLHYITILLATGAGLIWLWQLSTRLRGTSTTAFSWTTFGLATLASVLVVLASFLPVVAFDLKYNGLNSSAFVKLFTKEKIITGDKKYAAGEYVVSLARNSFDRLELVGVDKVLGNTGGMAAIVVIALLAAQLGLMYSSQQKLGQSIILVYFVTGAVGLALYKYSLFDHYLLYLIPLSLLLWANLLSWLTKRPLTMPIALAIISLFAIRNLEKVSFTSSGWTIFNMEQVAKETATRLQPGEKYDLILLSESGDSTGYNYRYFLSTQHTAPVFATDATELDALVIINENYQDELSDLELQLVQDFLTSGAVEERAQIEAGPEVIILRK